MLSSGAMERDDLIREITPDVLKSLETCKFFSKLDDLLCPADDSSTAMQCSGNFNYSKEILHSCGFNGEAIADILDVMAARGGCCDCEILYNVALDSRLRRIYWRTRAAQDTQKRHSRK